MLACAAASHPQPDPQPDRRRRPAQQSPFGDSASLAEGSRVAALLTFLTTSLMDSASSLCEILPDLIEMVLKTRKRSPSIRVPDQGPALEVGSMEVGKRLKRRGFLEASTSQPHFGQVPDMRTCGEMVSCAIRA